MNIWYVIAFTAIACAIALVAFHVVQTWSAMEVDNAKKRDEANLAATSPSLSEMLKKEKEQE